MQHSSNRSCSSSSDGKCGCSNWPVVCPDFWAMYLWVPVESPKEFSYAIITASCGGCTIKYHSLLIIHHQHHPSTTTTHYHSFRGPEKHSKRMNGWRMMFFSSCTSSNSATEFRSAAVNPLPFPTPTSTQSSCRFYSFAKVSVGCSALPLCCAEECFTIFCRLPTIQKRQHHHPPHHHGRTEKDKALIRSPSHPKNRVPRGMQSLQL